MKVDGRCHCGSSPYEAEIDPEKVAICHCTDCQTLDRIGVPYFCALTGRWLQASVRRIRRST